MLVVLSQKIDTESEYADELFKTYHYPSRYRNQLHAGDLFIYYQGNRFDKNHRYYFGTGVITQISMTDENNYYAALDNCKRFSQKVPIYLPDGGYIEQLGYQEVRKSINPPWQSSIRPLSKQAYNYVLSHAGTLEDIFDVAMVENMKEHLKKSVRSFFLENDDNAVLEIGKAAHAISKALNLFDDQMPDMRQLPEDTSEAVKDLIFYCTNMKMTYSYKPILIMALIELHDQDWNLSISMAARYFKKFYQQRRENGLPVELNKCIYLNPSVTINQVKVNLLSNPIKALIKSGFFDYSPEAGLLSLRPDLKKALNEKNTADILDICRKKLEQYYSRKQF